MSSKSGTETTDNVITLKSLQESNRAFEESDQRFQNLVREATVGIILLMGEEMIVKVVNDSYGKLIDRTPAELIGKPIFSVIPEAEPYFRPIIEGVKQTGEPLYLNSTPYFVMVEGVKKEGFLNLVYQPYREVDGTITGVMVLCSDVTEQVLAKKEVEELKNRFESMANNIPNLAWLANADGWIFWYNDRWYDYTGTTPKDMEGWGWQSVHDPVKLPSVLVEWQNSIDTGKPFEMTFPLKGRDNTFRPFLTRGIPVMGVDGKVISWVGTNTDISKQKQIEKLKDDFLSIASHELKTPLTTIKAYSQLAEKLLVKKGDEETLGMITKMRSQINKLSNLINELLDVTKLQKGELKYSSTKFDFDEMVKEVTEDSQKTVTTHEIETALHANVAIFGDRDKLTQVITNLITNAIKYSPYGKRVIVNTKAQEDKIQLSVQDFGIGISPEEQTKIFDQFYRVPGDTEAIFNGMGLGLYISSEIIKRHRGKIWVESTPGKGSIFYMLLPIDYQESNA